MEASLFSKHGHFSKDVFLSLVIPLYNQENEVKNCLRKIKEILDNTRLKYELIAVNDGSTDFRKVFSEMGIPDRWILTPGNSASEIRGAFQMFSQSAVRVSQAASFSKSALGGFVN